MGIREYIMFVVACDCCGDILSGSEEDEIDAERAAIACGWIRSGSEFICEACNEDNDVEYLGP